MIMVTSPGVAPYIVAIRATLLKIVGTLRLEFQSKLCEILHCRSFNLISCRVVELL